MIEPDWEQERPEDDEIEALWQTSVFSPVDMSSPALDELLAALRACYGSHHDIDRGVEFAAFSFPNDPRLHWFVSRNSFDEIGFYEALLNSEAFRATLPEITPSPDESIEWKWLPGSYTFDGELASLLMYGGAYVEFEGTGKQAKDLAIRACESLFGDRYEEVHMVKTNQTWSKWFHNKFLPWNYTYIGVDKGKQCVWIFCITDTD